MSAPSDPEIPPFRVEDLHGALKAPIRKPRGGAAWLVGLALAGAFWFAASGTRPDAGPKPEEEPIRSPEEVTAELVARQAKRQAELAAALPKPLEPLPAETAPVSQIPGAVPPGHVRLGAGQIASVFGDKAENRRRVAALVERAAGVGVKVLALPEACLSGYADITEGAYWTRGAPTEAPRAAEYDTRPPSGADPAQTHPIATIAEPRDGESVRFCADLARRHSLWLAAPFLEQDGENFYSAVTLLDAEGKSRLHWRKKMLWDSGDSGWATAGALEPETVDSPWGRIGLLISYDLAPVLPRLAGKKARIVLHCAAFYGQNFEKLLRTPAFLEPLRKEQMALVLANWTARTEVPWWQGWGMSRIVLPEGRTLRVQNDLGDALVVADLKTEP